MSIIWIFESIENSAFLRSLQSANAYSSIWVTLLGIEIFSIAELLKAYCPFVLIANSHKIRLSWDFWNARKHVFRLIQLLKELQSLQEKSNKMPNRQLLSNLNHKKIQLFEVFHKFEKIQNSVQITVFFFFFTNNYIIIRINKLLST